MPKVKAGGFVCEYELSSQKNRAMVHCTSQRLGIPYPCILDDSGKVKMELASSFGRVGLDTRSLPKTKDACLLNGFGFEVTAKNGIDNIKHTIRNYVDAVLNLVGLE